MKIIVLTAIKEFESHTKKLLRSSGILAYTLTSVSGYKNLQDSASDQNWFSAGALEQDSVLCMVFALGDQVSLLMQKVEQFNASQQFESRLHLAVLHAEAHI